LWYSDSNVPTRTVRALGRLKQISSRPGLLGVGGPAAGDPGGGPGQMSALLGRPQGPVMARVKPGDWMLTKRMWPLALNAGPQNSLSL
jgi:hypothetical protein